MVRGDAEDRFDLTLEELDQDGALGEALSAVYGSRADFLRKATLGGATFLGALALPGPSVAAAKNDVGILNYALVLEYQASLYTETQQVGAVGPKALEATHGVGAVERAHVKALRKALGSAAVARPRFNFRGTREDNTKFLKTAVAFEDLAVAAFKRRRLSSIPRRFSPSQSRSTRSRRATRRGCDGSSGSCRR